MGASDTGNGASATPPDADARGERTAAVKEYARDVGADLVGVADIDALEENPPNPEEPQVPSRIWPDEPETAVVMAQRMPMGEFLSDNQQAKGTVNARVSDRLGLVAHRVARFIEDEYGEKALIIAGEDNHPDYKGGAYGPMSMRHMAAEAGLGSFGLEANLLTPEYGPRVYFSALFTTADLEPDGLMEHQLCIGETCGRCLHACPSDAVEHFHLDKVSCASAAQVHGFRGILYGPLRSIAENRDLPDEVLLDMLDSGEMRNKFHSISRLINAFGSCPRCVEVCPIGIDYRKFLHQEHRNIPESTKQKQEKLDELFQARERGEFVDWNKPVNRRWIGEEGYKPFREVLDERAADADRAADVNLEFEMDDAADDGEGTTGAEGGDR